MLRAKERNGNFTTIIKAAINIKSYGFLLAFKVQQNIEYDLKCKVVLCFTIRETDIECPLLMIVIQLKNLNALTINATD